jgi:hypothetical protein
MKKVAKILFGVMLFSFTLTGCGGDDNFTGVVCGEYNGYELIKEPNGNCYYIDSKGHKIYLDSSNCDCGQ